MRTRLVQATVRQALLGLIAVAVSLPLLLALSRLLGLGTPPRGGMVLLSGSVLIGFAGGGLLGALLAEGFGRRPPRRVKLLAAFTGLIWGLVLCSAVLPLYSESVLDEMTDAGTELAFTRVGPLLDRPSGAVDQAFDVAGRLVLAGAARLPALALLGWALLGPVMAAALEARRPGGRL